MIKFFHYKKCVQRIFQNSLFLTETSPNSLASSSRSELEAEQKRDRWSRCKRLQKHGGHPCLGSLPRSEHLPRIFKHLPSQFLILDCRIPPFSATKILFILQAQIPPDVVCLCYPNRLRTFGEQESSLSFITLHPMCDCILHEHSDLVKLD